jgi:transposase
MQIFVDEISRRYANENLLMVVDGAGWHRSKKLVLPKNIKLLFLPPYSPELNPIEILWAELKEKYLHNRVFKSVGDLENQVIEGLLYYENEKEITKSIVAWNWIINSLCN